MISLRVSGILTTALVHGGVIAALVAFSSWSAAKADGPKLTEMTTIEASLAYKSKAKPTKQPQKPRRVRRPRPQTKPQGVSRDEQKAPVENKPEPAPEPEKQPDEPDYSELFEKYKEMRQSEEEEEGLPVEDLPQPGGGGEFDGSKHGFAEVNKGDPYMRELAAEMYQSWEVPTLETGKGSAVGCVHLGEDGHIVETKLEQSSENANIDRSVRVALEKLEELRESGDKPVPRHLMDATSQWICFKFSI